MNLREEIKSIYKNRPTREERNREKEEKNRYHRQGKHDAGRTKVIFPGRRGYQIALLVMAVAAICFFVMLIAVNALPADLTITLVVIVMVMLAASCLLFGSGKKWKRILGAAIAVAYMGICVMTSVYMMNTVVMLEKISDAGRTASGVPAVSVDVTTEPFNIYITGIDQWESEKGEDLERSDVNMIVTVNPKTKKILMTSIPRDTYVKLHTAQQMDKLTHTGVYGVGETLDTVHDWLGTDINYYVKMNFTAVHDIIDAMGGVRVYSPVYFESDISDYIYFKGWNELNGKEALYFARERHAFEGKDSIRVENQQRLMEAVIKKMTSSTTLLTRYGDIMAAAGNNLETNMSPSEMRDLVRMQVTDLADWDIETQKIEGEYDQDYVASLTQSMKFDVYKPSAESVRSCREKIDEVMNPDIKELNNIGKRNKSFFVNMFKRLTKTDKEAETEEKAAD